MGHIGDKEHTCSMCWFSLQFWLTKNIGKWFWKRHVMQCYRLVGPVYVNVGLIFFVSGAICSLATGIEHCNEYLSDVEAQQKHLDTIWDMDEYW